MKRVYKQPQIKAVLGEAEELLAGTVTGNVDNTPTIGYGGQDGDGTKDPEAKPYTMHSVWDE
jgi:hypothetical protein